VDGVSEKSGEMVSGLRR